MTARTTARYIVVALMGVAVLVATGDGFAQSYAGLYGWAVEHGLHGWKADSFPLMVDLFIAVGELGLFLLAIDGHRLRRSFMAWADLLVPALVAASGWGASLVFNVGHIKVHAFSYRATAAVPPLAAMVGLLVLLRTLHRYVAQADEASSQVREVAEPLALAVAPEDLAPAEEIDDTPAALLAWLRGEPVPEAEVHVPGGVPDPDPYEARAAEEFAEELGRGEVPSIRTIKRRMKIGQPRARQVRAYLDVLAEREPVPAGR
ncbi:DUF2637 domain-containing protein [Actinoallomurus sp. NBC_01490]|uniref:DUF2637 domain-containing protein n=1 Tax=Actinoallomurus sp. NBC_01490 TaxID=2903557 RepID=UPI002E2EB91B|nr:DUF2637 domain-containing protein [Actinoallomurus sp. NBC_01490]